MSEERTYFSDLNNYEDECPHCGETPAFHDASTHLCRRCCENPVIVECPSCHAWTEEEVDDDGVLWCSGNHEHKSCGASLGKVSAA
jgi:hypothetical protein